MEIKKVSNGLVSGYEAKVNQEPKENQNQVALGVASAVSSFENIGRVQTDLSRLVSSNSSSEPKSSKDLTQDQSQLAGNVNFESLPTESNTTDGRTRYEDGKANNPFNKGRDDKSSDPIADRQNAATDRSGPTGPDYSSKVNQVLTGDVSLPNDRYSEYGGKDSRADMKKGASGQMLMDDASKNQGQQRSIGKDSVAQDGGAGYKNVGGYDPSEGVKGGSGDAAKNNPGLNQAVNQTYIYGGAGSEREWALKMAENEGNPRDYTRSDGTRVQTGSDGTVVTTAKDGTKTVTKPDGSSTTVHTDGSYEDKDSNKKTTDKGGKLTDPGEDPGVAPEYRGLIGWDKLTPGAKMPRTGSNGGDIDPSEDAISKGGAIDSTYIQRTKLRNNVAQPADPENTSHGGRPIGSAPNGGGDIDYGPDSTQTGYSGTTRGGDGTDVDFSVGSTLEQTEDQKAEDSDPKKTRSKRSFILRG